MSPGTTLRRVGDVRPHMEYQGVISSDFVDPAPIALWSGSRIAAILYFRVEGNRATRRAVQHLDALDDGARRMRSIPIEEKIVVPSDATSEEGLDGIDPQGILSADVDGDGVQELVFMRRLGGAEVHAFRGRVARFPSPPAGPGAYYQSYLAHRVPLDGRDVVYLVSVRKPLGPEDPNLVLRVDDRGITRLDFRGLGARRILALGALQRPASAGVDELLLLLAEEGDKGTLLARYQPDGTLLAPPRRMYVPPPEGATFQFQPHSDRAVLGRAGRTLVLQPDREVNWIHTVEFGKGVDPADVFPLMTVDVATHPKAVYRAKDELWAVDAGGACFTPSAGGWVPLAKPSPYLKLPSALGSQLYAVWPLPDHRLLAVERRAKGERPMTHGDWVAAANRFLPPEDAARLRPLLEPSLETPDDFRDEAIALERRRKSAPAVSSVEEWKRVLPASYAETQQFNARRFDTEVSERFRAWREHPDQAPAAGGAALASFLANLELPARMFFTLIDGTSLSYVEVPGVLPSIDSQVLAMIDFQVHGTGLTAVLALEAADPEGRAEPAFYQVEAPFSAAR